MSEKQRKNYFSCYNKNYDQLLVIWSMSLEGLNLFKNLCLFLNKIGRQRNKQRTKIMTNQTK